MIIAKENGKLVMTAQVNQMLSKLHKGRFYYVKTEPTAKKFKRLLFIGFAGCNDCMLMFEENIRGSQWRSYSFLVTDYLRNHVQIFTISEYNEKLTKTLWDKIEKEISKMNEEEENANGKG